MCTQDSWQVTGSWKKDKNMKADEDFGKGKLGVRTRKIDPDKAMDMNLDKFSTHIKVWLRRRPILDFV